MSGAQLTNIVFDQATFLNIKRALEKNGGMSLFESAANGRKYPLIPTPHPLNQDLNLPEGDYAIHFSMTDDQLILDLKKYESENQLSETIKTLEISLNSFSATERITRIRENKDPSLKAEFEKIPKWAEKDKTLLLEKLSKWIAIESNQNESFFYRLCLLCGDDVARHIENQNRTNEKTSIVNPPDKDRKLH